MNSTRSSYGSGRQAIIEAAIRLVARNGLTGLTYRSLASEARMSKGVIQHHFSSIDAVIAAALDQVLRLAIEGAALPATIDDFFEPLIYALDSDHDGQTFQTDILLEARRHPALQSVVARYQEAYRSYLRSAVDHLGLKVDEGTLELLLAIADGIIYQRVAHMNVESSTTHRQVQALRALLQRSAS